jgi:hypothetical protein
LSNGKANSAADVNARDAAIALSFALQCGAALNAVGRAVELKSEFGGLTGVHSGKPLPSWHMLVRPLRCHGLAAALHRLEAWGLLRRQGRAEMGSGARARSCSQITPRFSQCAPAIGDLGKSGFCARICGRRCSPLPMGGIIEAFLDHALFCFSLRLHRDDGAPRSPPQGPTEARNAPARWSRHPKHCSSLQAQSLTPLHPC